MDHDTSADTAATRPRHGLSNMAVAIASYALFAVGIAALVSFFAPHVGVPQLAWHTGVLPTIAAPTEGDAVVNVAPLIVGVVAASVGVRLR